MLKSEKRNLKSYYVDVESNQVQKVINNTLEYYVIRARIYKRIYIALSILLLLINCSIPFINQLAYSSVGLIVTLLSSMATFISGVITFISLRDKWFRYRTSAENLKTECNFFNGGCGVYAKLSKSERERLLVEHFELINANDITAWKKELLQTSKNTSDKDKENLK